MHLKSYYDSKNEKYIYPDGHSYANGGINLKVVTNARFRSEFIINGDGKFLTLLDGHATQDAKVNCSSFNYARCNNEVHTVLDVEPAGEKYNYEPQFREEARYIHDESGNRVKNNKNEFKKYEAPKKIKSKYKVEWEKRKSDFELRCGHGKTNRT